jgi:hypothetical protein
MRDVLGRVGEMVLLAIAAPFIAADAVRDVRRSGEDVEAARREALRLEGERDEARRVAWAGQSELQNIMLLRAGDASILRTRSDQLKIVTKERDGYRANIDALDEAHTLTAQALDDCKRGRDVAYRSCTELQGEVDKARAERDGLAVALAAMEAAKDRAVADSSERWQRLRSERDAAELRALNLQREFDAMAADRWTQPQVIADHRAHLDAKAPCAWCHGHVGVWYSWLYVDEDHPELGKHRICETCEKLNPFDDDIRARVAARLASCPTRRTSADPHAVECSAGCGALAGEPCNPAAAVANMIVESGQ